jgi:hypothetical protein
VNTFRTGLSRSAWFTLAVAVAILAAGIAGAATKDPGGEPILLRYVFAKDQTQTYELAMQLRGRIRGLQPTTPPLVGRFTAKATSRVLSVAQDGSARIRLIVSDLKGRYEGLPNPPSLPGQAIIVEVTRDGTVRKTQGSSGLLPSTPNSPLTSFGSTGAAPTDPLSTLFFTQFPIEAIAPGQTWERSSDIPFPVGDGTITQRTVGEHEGLRDTPTGRVATLAQRSRMRIDVTTSFARIFQDFAKQLAGQAGVPSVSPPPQLQGVRLTMKGAMRGDSTNTIATATGDLLELDGKVAMDFALGFRGLPARGSALPGDIRIAFDVTMQLDRAS